MDLTFTAEEEAFRQEARTWLEAHVPSEPLPSMDGAEGFEAHRGWERTLNEGRWAMVSWPEEYGGRGVNLIEWLIFEEEYYRAGRAGPRQPERHLPPRADPHGVRHPRAEGPVPAQDGLQRGGLGQGWSEPNAGSDMAGIRATARKDGDGWRPSTARRRGPPAAAFATGSSALPHRPRLESATAASASSSCRSTPRA